MKRTANIVIRVTPKERKRLEAIAKREGLTISAWVRRFAYVEPTLPTPPEQTEHWIYKSEEK